MQRECQASAVTNHTKRNGWNATPAGNGVSANRSMPLSLPWLFGVIAIFETFFPVVRASIIFPAVPVGIVVGIHLVCTIVIIMFRHRSASFHLLVPMPFQLTST